MNRNTDPHTNLLRFFIWLACSSFVLNWIWEMLQMQGYKEMAGHPFQTTMERCARATLGDVAITFWSYSLGALACNNSRWGLYPRWNVYCALALLGAANAYWIEKEALRSGGWTYTGIMPIVPVLHVGMWPLLQLSLLVPVSAWLSDRLARAK